MSDELDKMFAMSLQDLKGDIKQLDSKLDIMHEVLIKNTVVLNEHERRSTASEGRLEIVEDKVYTSEKQWERIKGFFFYAGIILSALGSLAYMVNALLHN